MKIQNRIKKKVDGKYNEYDDALNNEYKSKSVAKENKRKGGTLAILTPEHVKYRKKSKESNLKKENMKNKPCKDSVTIKKRGNDKIIANIEEDKNEKRRIYAREYQLKNRDKRLAANMTPEEREKRNSYYREYMRKYFKRKKEDILAGKITPEQVEKQKKAQRDYYAKKKEKIKYNPTLNNIEISSDFTHSSDESSINNSQKDKSIVNDLNNTIPLYRSLKNNLSENDASIEDLYGWMD